MQVMQNYYETSNDPGDKVEMNTVSHEFTDRIVEATRLSNGYIESTERDKTCSHI